MLLAIDTNVLIRYITRDDLEQASIADWVIERGCSEDEPGFVSHIVLCEVAWVLKSAYAADRDHVAKVIETLLQARQLKVQASDIVWRALADYRRHRADFADTLINQQGITAGCDVFVSFDKRAAELPHGCLADEIHRANTRQ